MKISKSQKLFIERNGENYPTKMGPNWRTILNFWLFVDTLTESQIEIVGERNCEINVDDFRSQRELIAEMSGKTIRDPYCVWSCARECSFHWRNDNFTQAVEWATDELISHHLLLEQGKELIYVPLFDDL